MGEGYEALDQLMSDIADAIRTRDGIHGEINVQDFIKKIRNIDVIKDFSERMVFLDTFNALAKNTGGTYGWQMLSDTFDSVFKPIFSNATDYPKFWLMFVHIFGKSNRAETYDLFLFYPSDDYLGQTFDDRLLVWENGIGESYIHYNKPQNGIDLKYIRFHDVYPFTNHRLTSAGNQYYNADVNDGITLENSSEFITSFDNKNY